MTPLRLLLENPILDAELEIIHEEDNRNAGRTTYIQGPYLLSTKPNKNKRIYDLNEMSNEVARYKKELIDTKRSLGALDHPENSVDISLATAAHMVVALEQRGEYFWGKSKILSTPMGTIAKSLLNDGVRLGISSRSLGRLTPEGENNKVSGLKLLAMDLVQEPSYDQAVLDSLMENRQFIISEGGRIVELACDSLACRLDSIPKHDVDTYLKEAFTSFIKALKG